MDLATFLIQCLNALQYGLLLFLVASGLTLIFGIMGVINLAHGSFYMIGAYMAFALAPLVASHLRRRLLRHAAGGLVLAVLLGYVLEWAFFSYLYEREHLQQVLMTYGLILVFEELRSLLVGDDVHGVQAARLAGRHAAAGRADDLPGVPAVHLGVCLALALGMWFVFTARGWA
jgi:branched-chain amino acid transport system permease protein